MQLQQITAISHPAGNRIDLAWVNPDPGHFPGVRVVRREGSHPLRPKDGVLVAEGPGLTAAVDQPLKGETVYYYSLFPFTGSPPVYDVDRHNRASAMATAPYDFAGQMHRLLPAIYHRYDKLLPRPPFPPDMPLEDRARAQLRRFLDLPGSQLDQLYSYARSLRDLYDVTRVDGDLLPLLAAWIGWSTDYQLELAAQRNEIRHAPFVYETIGLVPTIEATVKRISGWESRTKEFVHNIFLSNRPERLNLWLQRRTGNGPWSRPTEPLSLNFAYSGRPAAALTADGTRLLCYHRRAQGRWDIWYKISRDDGQTWMPSRPLTSRPEMDQYPAAAAQGDTLWVFWSVWDETKASLADEAPWHIDFRTHDGRDWSPVQVFRKARSRLTAPAAVVDDTKGLWLFWQEWDGGRWQLKYNRHDGGDWQLREPASFPLDAGADPRVEDDVFVLFNPASAKRRLWVFWSRQTTVASGGTRSSIFFRTKQTLDPNLSDWSAVGGLPKVGPGDDYNDREPAALVDGSGNINLFWSTDQSGPWLIRRNTLTAATLAWGTAEEVTTGPYSWRNSLPIAAGADTLLIYRSNEGVLYHSATYGATETLDLRYAGSTTIDTRNGAKNALRQKFDDFQAYTYDYGQPGEPSDDEPPLPVPPEAYWYTRGTVGLYLTPDTNDDALIKNAVERMRPVLSEFMPATERAVFIR